MERIKKLASKRVKEYIRSQVKVNDNQKNVPTVTNPNLILTNISVNSEKVLLTVKEDQPFRISRLGYLVSAEKKIYDLPFSQKENKIELNQKDLQSIDILGKHVFRIFYENDTKAHTMQLDENNNSDKYPISAENQKNNSNFLYFYTNINQNLTLQLVSKSRRKTAPKYIQGYLDGQFESIKLNNALFEANHGKTNSGNMFALAIELASRQNFKIYWASKNPISAQKMFEFYGISNIEVIEHLSYEYGNIMATAELLFSDNTFYPFFSKREGQRYINTWHGTPLKTLGEDIKGEETSFGNIVKNMLQVDNMYFSNRHTADHHLSSLDLDGVLNTNVYIAPSPRNSSFFNRNHAEKIKETEQLQEKKVFVYLPTYRGKSSGANDEGADKIRELLNNFVSILPENYIIYYKLHPIDTQKLSISSEDERIRKIPEEYELYDFLSVTDGLITDYSSVMFDYALSDMPIYLYTYDQEEYFSERGTYLDINDLPFPRFTESEKLIKEMSNSRENLTEFKSKFAPYDNKNGAKEIIDHVLFKTNSANMEKYNSYNGKPNVYIMGGSLWANGVTSALKNVIDNIDLNKRNYILLVDSNNFKQSDIGRYLFFDDRIKVYPYKGYAMRSNFEDTLVKKYESGKDLSSAEFKHVKSAFNREINRIFGLNAPDYFIHFSGYEIKFAEFTIFMEQTKTIMYVHNDMFKEYATRKNFNKNVISEAYTRSNKVVLVNEELKPSFIEHFPDSAHKVVVANNFIGYKNIKNTENASLGELLLDTSFQYSIASQGQGNPLSALKSRLLNGSRNTENRFSEINKIYGSIEKAVSGIVRNNYLHVTNDDTLKKIIVKSFFNQECTNFHNQFGTSDDMDDLMIELLYPKSLEKYRSDILPKSVSEQTALNEILLNKRPEKIDDKLEPIRNVYNVYGLRKLEVIEELYDENLEIFVNIARFDQQKRLDRLILAFEKVFESDSNTRLYIVASHGKERDNILKLVRESSASRAIRIFGAMDNPYPLLKRCDCFVFTSDYEALGLVVYEALALGLPVVSTNLETTMKNLNSEQVCPVDLSVDGVYEGMQKFLSGDYPNKTFDFEGYEQRSRKEFEKIF